MVLIDGHEANWLRRYHAASAELQVRGAICRSNGSSPHSSSPCNPNRFKDDEEGDVDGNFCFMHLNLAEVPWQQLQTQEQVSCRRLHHPHHRLNDDVGENSTDEDRFQEHSEHPRQHRHLALDVVDCTGLESGLRHILNLPLQRLYVSSETTFGQDIGRILSAGLSNSSWCLQKLQLSSATWTPAAVRGLSEGLRAATALQQLDLSYTHWKKQPVQHVRLTGDMRDFILFDVRDFTRIDVRDFIRMLEDAYISNVDADSCVTLLSRGLAKSQIVCLKLNRCHLTDTQIALLVREGLMDHGLMQELYLGGNSLGNDALHALAEYLQSPSGNSLVTLGLNNPLLDKPVEDIHSHGALDGSEAEATSDTKHLISFPGSRLAILYPALAVNTSLRALHLASNNLHDEDMPLLCRAMSHSCITMLDLKCNRVTDRGIRELSARLPPQLERLWLLGNPMGVQGAQCLYNTLKERHVNLTDLRIPTYFSFRLIPELVALDEACHNYLILNQGGRRILTEEDADGDPDSDYGRQQGDNSITQRTDKEETLHRRPKVPMALWPLVLARVNRAKLVIPWGRSSMYLSQEANRAHAMFFLLRNGSLLRQRG